MILHSMPHLVLKNFFFDKKNDTPTPETYYINTKNYWKQKKEIVREFALGE